MVVICPFLWIKAVYGFFHLERIITREDLQSPAILIPTAERAGVSVFLKDYGIGAFTLLVFYCQGIW